MAMGPRSRGIIPYPSHHLRWTLPDTRRPPRLFRITLLPVPGCPSWRVSKMGLLREEARLAGSPRPHGRCRAMRGIDRSAKRTTLLLPWNPQINCLRSCPSWIRRLQRVSAPSPRSSTMAPSLRILPPVPVIVVPRRHHIRGILLTNHHPLVPRIPTGWTGVRSCSGKPSRCGRLSGPRNENWRNWNNDQFFLVDGCTIVCSSSSSSSSCSYFI